ncbi:META domain-containing protein [Acinetobacter sp.]|uniref:META domain-containing protein n=1 Tax=Acinetobacter sp. TaxID=472 RepID=UPI00264916C1|nr:META domain-containing protein [Acinetobacter sp.]MDN5512152.1 META domain-containing protein [Acinetobacter sp.]MDN5524175.1 META domain-containing protein [Acinetobacter sp.]
MLKKFFAVGILGTAIALTACQTTPNAASNIEAANLVQLQNRTWIATYIGNTEIKTVATARNIPSLQFDAASKRISGADGCNRIMGSYEAGRDTLLLSQMAGTKMACLDNNNLSEQFNAALAKVANYQVFGKTLKLLDRHGNVVLQFTSPVQPR